VLANCLCLVTQVFFILIEAVQLRAQGWEAYVSDAWNLVDGLFFLQYLVYFVCRMLERGNVIPARHLSPAE
jgi:hypothetical protein